MILSFRSYSSLSVAPIAKIMPIFSSSDMVYSHVILGLYCSGCLAQVNDLKNDQFVIFGNLAKMLVNLVEDYDKDNRS
jgi:hypothetical protein